MFTRATRIYSIDANESEKYSGDVCVQEGPGKIRHNGVTREPRALCWTFYFLGRRAASSASSSVFFVVCVWVLSFWG